MDAPVDIARENLSVMGVPGNHHVDAEAVQAFQFSRFMLKKQDGSFRLYAFCQSLQSGPFFHTVPGPCFIAAPDDRGIVEFGNSGDFIGQQFPPTFFQKRFHPRIALGVFGTHVGKTSEQGFIHVVITVDHIGSVSGLDLTEYFRVGIRIFHGTKGACDDIAGYDNQIRLLCIDPLNHVFVDFDR